MITLVDYLVFLVGIVVCVSFQESKGDSQSTPYDEVLGRDFDRVVGDFLLDVKVFHITDTEPAKSFDPWRSE